MCSEIGVDEQTLHEVLPEGSERWVVLGSSGGVAREISLEGVEGQNMEARALCTAVQNGCSCAGAGGARLLCLVENMALCLSVGRSRTRNFKLLRILRIIAGWTLAFGVALSMRFVRSECNTSDDPSRSGGTCEDGLHHEKRITTTSNQGRSGPLVVSPKKKGHVTGGFQWPCDLK